MKSISKTNWLLQIAMLLSFTSTPVWGQSVKTTAYKNAENTKAISVNFNKNVELLGYMVHLAEPEDNDPSHPISIELNKWPGDLNNTSLSKIYELAGDKSYGFFAALFVQLPDFPLPENYVFPQSVLDRHDYTTNEEISRIKTLLDLTSEFYQNSKFETLWSNLEPHRAKTTETLKTVVESQNFAEILTEMEGFYQQKFATYQIVPSLTIWSGPGWGFNDTGKSPMFVLGPLNKNYDYTDTEKLKNLSVHEFGHSFVNHLVLQNLSDYISETEHLYLPLKESMTPQGYPNWEGCIIEHFVRAGEVLIPELMGNEALSQSNLNWNIEEKKFIYLPFIVDHLRDYRLNKGLSYKESLINTMIDLKEEFR